MASVIENSTRQSACFFCEKRGNDAPLRIDLYKVTKRQETYVVFGSMVQQAYQNSTIEVPRCRSCERKHSFFSLSGGIPACVVVPAALLLCGLVAGRWWQAAAVFDFVMFFGFLVFVVVGIYMCFAALGLLFMIVEFVADCLGCNTERRSRKFEPLSALLGTGWQFGKEPHKSEHVEDA